MYKSKRFYHVSRYVAEQAGTKVTLKPGLDKTVVKQGDDKTYPQRGQKVKVHYTGMFVTILLLYVDHS
jgi:FKBP-type peptidyl-prolyl cis-trans isomerase